MTDTTQTVARFQGPFGNSSEIKRRTFGAGSQKKKGPRVSIVAGLHGNEYDGIYICNLLIQRLIRHDEQGSITGEINIYPVANPDAVLSGERSAPYFAEDLNRQFGSQTNTTLPGQMAQILFKDIQERSDYVFDIHASNLHLAELPQIRILEKHRRKLIPLAQMCNTDILWVHPLGPVYESTLAYNLNRNGIPALVIETGICLRIHQEYCFQILQGLLNFLRKVGCLKAQENTPDFKTPQTLNPDQVVIIQAPKAGLFIPRIALGKEVQSGDWIGELIDPLSEQEPEPVFSPARGLLFTLRQHPLTRPGSTLARIALKSHED
jgi:uncharacterized protein